MQENMDTTTTKRRPGRPTGFRLKPEFDVKRKQVWARARAQAEYRGEIWDLDFDSFCRIMTEDVWQRRGRDSDSLCLCMYDPEQGWRVGNIALLTRKMMITQAIKRRFGLPWEKYWQDAIWAE